MGEPVRPVLMEIVLDCADVRRTADFYAALMGYHFRPGDGPEDGEKDWLVLLGADGERRLAFQQVPRDEPTTWPEDGVPMQAHLDTRVPDRASLDAVHERVLALGGTLRFDRSDDPGEPLRVYADPAGHLFCVLVSRD